MNSRLLRACAAVSLAVLGVWLLTTKITQANNRNPGPSSIVSPLMPRSHVTPTLRLVGPNGESLSSPLVHRVLVSDTAWQYPLRVYNPYTAPVTVVAELLTVPAATQGSLPATLGLSPGKQTVAAGKWETFSLSLIEGWLPPGTYTGTLRFSAAGIEPATQQFVLLASTESAVLEWAQKDFVYVASAQHPTATVRVMARNTDAEDVQLELTTLWAGDAVTTPFNSADFLSITPPLLPTLTHDDVSVFTLNFNSDELPVPGTYSGTLRLSASNAAAIKEPFTLVVPDERARGTYRLAVAELGKSPPVTTALTLTTALQFTGVRWLPGLASVVSWWPAVVGSLILGVGVAVLVGYTVWALAKPKPKKDNWIRRNGPAVGAGLAAIVLLLVLSFILKLTQPHVGDRNVFVSEAEGRGPVRQVRVLPGEVTNEVGNTAEIHIGKYDTTIEAGDVLTVPLSIQGIPQPGVYQGHILIQSPDIAEGLAKVPLQVTVHDVIFWPALVIALGVAVGGWMKYLGDTVGERLEWRKKLEEAWDKWNAYLGRDPYHESAGRINPIYTRVRQRIDIVLGLLEWDREWGIQRAQGTVTGESGCDKELERYEALGDRLTRLKVGLEALDTDISRERKEFASQRQRAKEIITGLETKIPPEAKEEYEALWRRVQALPPSPPLDLYNHVQRESDALEKELRDGRLSDAEQRWQRAFEVRSKVDLAILRDRMNTWAGDDNELKERLKRAGKELDAANGYLAASPSLYVEAWLKLIQAEAMFEADTAQALAEKAQQLQQKLEEPREEEWGPADVAELSGSVKLLERVLPQPVGPRIVVKEPRLYWGNIGPGTNGSKITCKLTIQADGFDAFALPGELKARTGDRQEISLKVTVSGEAHLGEGEYSYDLSYEFSAWDGGPIKCEVVDKDGTATPVTVEVHSPYTIELPAGRGDIVAGERLFCQTTFQGQPEERADHRSFKWKFNGEDFEDGEGALGEEETPSGRHAVPFEYDQGKARIELEVYSDENGSVLIQKALLEGVVREPRVIELYQDKRRQNFKRRLAALLLALVGGMAAKRVFGLTFGSFEEYLGTFSWGVGASLGIDPVANGYNELKTKVQDFLK